MPEIGEVKPIEAPPIEVKPGVKVVPKREIDKKAEEMKARRQLPAPPGSNVDFDTMIQWLGLLTEEMWKQTIVRVYRHDPVLNNELIAKDSPAYIDVIGGMFDLDYMIEHHGGGKYGFFINGGDGSKKLFEARLSIPVTQYDPKFDIRALDVNAKDNIKWVNWARMKGLLDKDNRPVENKKSEATATSSPAEAVANAMLAGMDRAAQLLGRNQQRNNDDSGGLGNTIGTILVEKMKQDDPNRSTESMVKLFALMKGDGNNTQIFQLFQMMMQQQNESNIRMMELMKELRTPVKDKDDEEEKQSPMSQLRELLEVGEQLGIKVGGRGGARSGWDTAADMAKDILPPVFNMVTQIIHSNTLARQANTGLQATSPPVPGNNPSSLAPQSSLAPPSGSYASMGANANPSPEEKLPPPPPPPIMPNSVSHSPDVPVLTPDAIITSPQIQEIQLALNSAGGLIQKQIMDGVKGYDFADNLVKMFGHMQHARMAKHGVETLIEAMKTVPAFYTPLVDAYGEEYLFNWVGEFVNYEEILARLDADDFDNDDTENDEPEKSMPVGGKK